MWLRMHKESFSPYSQAFLKLSSILLKAAHKARCPPGAQYLPVVELLLLRKRLRYFVDMRRCRYLSRRCHDLSNLTSTPITLLGALLPRDGRRPVCRRATSLDSPLPRASSCGGQTCSLGTDRHGYVHYCRSFHVNMSSFQNGPIGHRPALIITDSLNDPAANRRWRFLWFSLIF